jgi:hypothetical protein
VSLYTLQEQAEIGVGSLCGYCERAHEQQVARHIVLDVEQGPSVQCASAESQEQKAQPGVPGMAAHYAGTDLGVERYRVVGDDGH